MSDINNVVKDITPYLHNPSAIAMKVMNIAADARLEHPVDILDPNNPLVFSIENSIMLAHASITNHEQTLRKVYPIMATTYEELYPHMADKDFIDRFAQPATETFQFMIGADELRNMAMPPDSKDTRRLIIPRDSSITVNGVTFTMQYPIELRVHPHNGIQVIYQTDKLSPIRMLESNVLKYGTKKLPLNGGRLVEQLIFEVPMMQYNITSIGDTVNSGSSFKQRYAFTDQFYYARTFVRKNNVWVELETTHAETPINPLKPMVQYKVLEDNRLQVQVPDLYIRNNNISGDIRTDIYTTKGKISLDLSAWKTDEFKFKMADYNNETPESFYSPIRSISNMTVWSSNVCEGGRDELSFLKLRDRVIDNAIGTRVPPASHKQLASENNNYGYDTSLSIDYVTDRKFKISKGMYPSTLPEVSTPIGTLNGILETSPEELANLSSVYDNGKRMTLSPDTLYRYENGDIRLMELSIPEFKRLDLNTIVNTANNSTLLFTPFHYVLDINNDVIEMRPYYLSKGDVSDKQFHEVNTTLNLDVGIGSYSIEQTSYGYKLLIQTRSGEVYKSLDDSKVHAQMSFTPRGYSNDYAYVDGTLLGWNTEEDERIWEFQIHCNYDIDKNDDLIVNNFTLFGGHSTDIPMMLMQRANILFGVTNYNPAGYKASDLDKIYQSDNSSMKAIIHESLMVNLGHSAHGLWSNARYVTGSMIYRRYEEDVLDYYDVDIKKRNADNTFAYTVDTSSGKPVIVWEYEHRKGDPVMINGVHKVKHKAGTVVYNGNEPIIDKPRSIRYRLELLTLDAKYRLSERPETVNYLDIVIRSIRESIVNDVPILQTPLYDQSELFFYPKSTMGNIRVLMADGQTCLIDSAQVLNFKAYVTDAARRDSDLLERIKNIITNVVNEEFTTKRMISTTEIVDNIKQIKRDENIDGLIDINMTLFGDREDQTMFTIYNDTDSVAIAKKLTIEPDSSLSIRNHINIAFSRYSMNK